MAKLSVSAPRMDCAEVTSVLASCGVLAKVTPNFSTQPVDARAVRAEPGCTVLLTEGAADTKTEVARAWSELQRRFGLTCAHVQTQKFGGCVYDFLRDSHCPQKDVR